MNATVTVPPGVEPFDLAKQAGANMKAEWGVMRGSELTVFDVSQEALDAALAAYDADAIRASKYRLYRKAAYMQQLGQDPGDFINTVGDVLDDIIRELVARGAPVTPEFQTLVDKVTAIKAAYPKPA